MNEKNEENEGKEENNFIAATISQSSLESKLLLHASVWFFNKKLKI